MRSRERGGACNLAVGACEEGPEDVDVVYCPLFSALSMEEWLAEVASCPVFPHASVCESCPLDGTKLVTVRARQVVQYSTSAVVR